MGVARLRGLGGLRGLAWNRFVWRKRGTKRECLWKQRTRSRSQPINR